MDQGGGDSTKTDSGWGRGRELGNASTNRPQTHSVYPKTRMPEKVTVFTPADVTFEEVRYIMVDKVQDSRFVRPTSGGKMGLLPSEDACTYSECKMKE